MNYLDWAKSQIGVHENPSPNVSDPDVIAIRKLAGCNSNQDDGDLPWCRIFVVAAFTQDNNAPCEKNWMARSVEHDQNFHRLDGPAYGCVVSMWRGSVHGGQGHTGFYMGEDATHVWILGGNEGDAVKIAAFPKNGRSMGVVGYYWHNDYDEPEIGAIPYDGDAQETSAQ